MSTCLKPFKAMANSHITCVLCRKLNAVYLLSGAEKGDTLKAIFDNPCNKINMPNEKNIGVQKTPNSILGFTLFVCFLYFSLSMRFTN